MRELMKDNVKTGKARGAGGTPRSRKQMIAIALSAAGKSKAGTDRYHEVKGGMGIIRKVLGGRMGK